jgi:hypothetical protein
MREMNFSESNLGNRWLGVKSIWRQIQGEVKRVIKFQIERALVLEQRDKVGCVAGISGVKVVRGIGMVVMLGIGSLVMAG